MSVIGFLRSGGDTYPTMAIAFEVSEMSSCTMTFVVQRYEVEEDITGDGANSSRADVIRAEQ